MRQKKAVLSLVLMACIAPASSGLSDDPCDISDLIARAKIITDQNSLAATDARQRFKQEFDARAAACEASRTSPNNAPPPSTDNAAMASPGSMARDSSVNDLLNPDTKEDSADKAAKAGQEMQKETADFFKSAKDAWESLKGEAGIIGPLKQACEELGDSFEMAAEASSGELPAFTKSVKALKQYVEKQSEVLSELAHKNPQDWLAYSGATDPASFASARQQLDQVSTRFASIQNIARHFMPIVRAAEHVSENQSVVRIRFAATPITTVGLDPIALDWVWSQLSGSTASIDTIQSNIRAARAAIQDEQARKERAQRTREREEEDQTLNLGTSEKHTDWESRRGERRKQQDTLMRQMNQIIASEPDEQRRHALLEDISQQLQKIHEDQKLDKEPQ
jgi:hypothetical protein